MITILYRAYAVTNFIKHIYFKNMSVSFHRKFEHSSVMLINLFVMDFVSLNNCTLCRPCCVHISDSCTWMAEVK